MIDVNGSSVEPRSKLMINYPVYNTVMAVASALRSSCSS
jgi:hypothetical protein